jgi:hypothetical protein
MASFCKSLPKFSRAPHLRKWCNHSLHHIWRIKKDSQQALLAVFYVLLTKFLVLGFGILNARYSYRYEWGQVSVYLFAISIVWEETCPFRYRIGAHHK